MTFQPPDHCSLCGNTDRRELRYRLVHWKLAEPGMAYEHVPACSDYAACQSRVEASKRTWPLIETPNRGAA